MRGVASDYLTLTKPPIISLLLITATGGMFLAAEGVPPLQTLAMVLVGGTLGAGGANAINHFLDQDIDAMMSRTVKRPVASNRIAPMSALAFGIALNVGAFFVLAYWVNLLAASLTLAATLFYILVYTGWLKRNTPQNIVIGGAAGAILPMVRWAAVTGGLELPALYLFSIVFFWTPPHFWALALLIQKDYEKAGVPMLPVVSGVAHTKRHILGYSLVLFATALAPALLGFASLFYGVCAALLGGCFLVAALRVLRHEGDRPARQMFGFSILYLFMIFAILIVDKSLGLAG